MDFSIPSVGNSSTWSGKLVGFAGFAGSGKNHLADQLGWAQCSFAEKLKTDLVPFVAGFGIDLSNPDHKRLMRPLLVGHGESLRRLAPDAWIDRLTLPASPAAVTDVRYLNECEFVWDKGGIVFYIDSVGVEPANAEERRSFGEIFDHLRSPAGRRRAERQFVYVKNDRVTDSAARQVRAMAQAYLQE